MWNGETGITLWQFLRLIVLGVAGVFTVLLLVGAVTPRASRLLSPRHREEPK